MPGAKGNRKLKHLRSSLTACIKTACKKKEVTYGMHYWRSALE